MSATPPWIEEAIASNHRALFHIEALLAGGALHESGDLAWTESPRGSNIIFPRLTRGEAATAIDVMMDRFKADPPRQAGCWSMDPSQPADLGAYLLARGFQMGWKPHWMMIDLSSGLREDHPFPSDIVITEDKTTDLTAIADLPYAASDTLTQNGLLPHVITERFVARLDGRIVGHSGVLCTPGPVGIAGLYNVAVVPPYRNKGIGKALVLAACRYARDRGWRYGTLNATYDGRRIYKQVGFYSLGDGLTWWLSDGWREAPPGTEEVRVAEAIGRGDVAGLTTPMDLLRPLVNKMTLMDLAVNQRQSASVRWLAARGVPLRPMDAWDMGWRDEAAALLTADPSSVDLLYTNEGMALLHFAVERDDRELLALGLAHRPNLAIQDSRFQGTPIGWAHHLGRTGLIPILQNAAAASH